MTIDRMARRIECSQVIGFKCFCIDSGSISIVMTSILPPYTFRQFPVLLTRTLCFFFNSEDYGIVMFSFVGWIVLCSSSLMDYEEGIMTQLLVSV